MAGRSLFGGLLAGLVLSAAAAPSGPDPQTTDHARQLIAAVDAGFEQDYAARFEALVERHRLQLDLPEAVARIEVIQQLAEIEAERAAWMEAAGRLNQAIVLAETLADPDRLFAVYLRQAELFIRAGERGKATTKLRLARDLARLSLRPAEELQAGLLLLELHHRQGIWSQFTDEYDRLLALPGANQLAIELHRAQRTSYDPAAPAIARWERVLTLAQARSDAPHTAMALDHLGFFQTRAENWAAAEEFYRAAEALDTDYQRPLFIAVSYSDTLAARGEAAQAAAILQQALDSPRDSTNPAMIAELHTHRAEHLAAAGDFETAFAELQQSNRILNAQNRISISSPAMRMSPITRPEEINDAALLAAARTALREAELASTRQQRNTTVALSVAALLLALALAVAYHFKRRAAAALAEARDAAELRAERTRWQMLRYQLSPHFLFNALASLSGLVLTDAKAAREVIGRLSQFCRYALERTTDNLRTVEEEFAQIEAFLGVEQAGMGDRLRVEIKIDPAAKRHRLPPLILQPLAENALKYGAPASGEVLEIRIEARLDPTRDQLILEVANTGQWVEPGDRPSHRESIGLNNVRQRLEQLRGSADGLTIHPREGWVAVRVGLPSLTSA